MRKEAKRSVLLDKLHKGVVITCIGLTIYSTALLGQYVYTYLTQRKPEIEGLKAKIDQELLSEGSSDKILLKDNAKQLNI